MAKIAVVRYGAMEKTGCFSAPDTGLQVGNDVIVRTPRGVEWGSVVLLQEASSEKDRVAGEVLRKATPADREKQRDIVEHQQVEDFKCCKKLIKKHKLPKECLGTGEHTS